MTFTRERRRAGRGMRLWKRERERRIREIREGYEGIWGYTVHCMKETKKEIQSV